jgi:hypothetical protein
MIILDALDIAAEPVATTKDKESGPVLAFNQSVWNAFLAGAKDGEFDSI